MAPPPDDVAGERDGESADVPSSSSSPSSPPSGHEPKVTPFPLPETPPPTTDPGGDNPGGDESDGCGFAFDPDVHLTPHLSQFDSTVVHPALIVPARRVSELKDGVLRHVMMRRPKTRNVVEVPSEERASGAAGGEPGANKAAGAERKLILARRRPQKKEEVGRDGGVVGDDPSRSRGQMDEDDDEEIDIDDVYEDEAVRALLASPDDDTASTGSGIRKSTHVITTDYSDCTAERAMRRVLPPSVLDSALGGGVPSAFEVVGRVAHVNLPPALLPYRRIVGRIILDKNQPRIRTVVNKIGTVDTEYRTFKMDIVAGYDGKDALEVTLSENGCRFSLDFEKVYWNSRLQREHARLVDLIARTSGGMRRRKKHQPAKPSTGERNGGGGKRAKGRRNKRKRRGHNGGGGGGGGGEHPGDCDDGAAGEAIADAATHRPTEDDTGEAATAAAAPDGEEEEGGAQRRRRIVVADVMAGVGPFAVPLASLHTNVTVHANDLNPTSHAHLVRNAKSNSCGEDLVPYNLDGRAFLRRLDADGVRYDHVIMNLPATAVEFLDVFRGWKPPDSATSDGGDPPCARPMIHVYCFEGKDEEEARVSAIRRCEAALGCELGGGCGEEDDEATATTTVHVVRDVAPNKNMLCVSFRLPEGVSCVERIDV